jgi:glycolate oxidase iron-sulfur subunit
MQLKRNKLSALASGEPEEILTANIGCQVHLAAGTALPVRHWIVALEERLKGGVILSEAKDLL